MHASVLDIEMKLLIQAIHARYGYDFAGYNEASFKRLIGGILSKNEIPTISRLQDEILRNTTFFAQILPDLTVSTSEMFRDPVFYATLRDEVIPVLETYSSFKVWHAGCSTGEEVYSLAILLSEAGLYDRALIYATDINPFALQAAEQGLYPWNQMAKFAENYLNAGCGNTFSSYYEGTHGTVRFNPDIRRNIVFAEHNLVVDEVFCEVNLILCRNVMIYFSPSLQERVIDLFSRSLSYKGFLCLGNRESLQHIRGGDAYAEVSKKQQIFRKIVRTKDPLY